MVDVVNLLLCIACHDPFFRINYEIKCHPLENIMYNYYLARSRRDTNSHWEHHYFPMQISQCTCCNRTFSSRRTLTRLRDLLTHQRPSEIHSTLHLVPWREIFFYFILLNKAVSCQVLHHGNHRRTTMSSSHSYLPNA